MAAVSVRSNDGNPASAGGGRMVRFAGFTAEAPAVGSAAEEGAAGTGELVHCDELKVIQPAQLFDEPLAGLGLLGGPGERVRDVWA